VTIAPDQGMRYLFAGARPGPDPAPAPAAPPAGAAAGAELDIAGRLVLVLDGLAAATRNLERAARARQHAWESCHVVQITPNVTVTQPNGTLLIDDPDRWGPRQGWAWCITRLTIVMASGATATVYRDAPTSGNEMLPSVTAGTWEPKGAILLPGQRMVVLASAAAVVNGDAVEMPLDMLPAFLL